MILREGDIGNDVALLQKRLTRAAFAVAETHVFDQATEAAVMAPSVRAASSSTASPAQKR